jgi:flagellar biosynthesis protein FlhA
VGVSLISFISDGANSPLLRRIGTSASSWRRNWGSLFPAVRVTDNLSLRAREYSISLKGIEMARFELPQGWNWRSR